MRKRLPFTLHRLLTLVAFVLVSAAGLAQSNQGALAGTILDPSGSVVPNASVVARNTANGESFAATSTGSGD